MITPALEMHGVLKVQLFQQMLEIKTCLRHCSIYTDLWRQRSGMGEER